MKLRNPLLLIILCVFAVACRMGTGENALLHNEENGISIVRYDKLQNLRSAKDEYGVPPAYQNFD